MQQKVIHELNLKMKQVKRFGFATALLCVTSLLIAAFMVLFSYYG
jgi:hypothetical protein